jgi:glycosyltransferase involved in cell wall biosynthesis
MNGLPHQPPASTVDSLPASLHVAVDARTVYAPTRRGTGKNLVDLYTLMARQRPSWRFTLFHQREADDPFVGLPNVRARRIDIKGDRLNLWQDVRLPLAAAMSGADVLHCPANTAPAWTTTPTVVTIHDLTPLDITPDAPETKSWVARVGRGARRARRILTPSDFTRRRLIAQFNLPADRITVNPWAPAQNCHKVEDPRVILDLRAKYEIPDRSLYVMTFGAADPYKNTQGVLDAWAQIAPEVGAQSHLLIVGVQPVAQPRLREQAAARLDGRSYGLHGFVPEEDISGLLSGASALCFPSRAEGFGLPILDAFVCGTPVITSNRTSLPEVAGDAAWLVDPDDPGTIAKAIEGVLRSSETRNRMSDAGHRRLAAFSWDRCAHTAATVLAAAAGK